MKVTAIFGEGDPVIQLWPENDREKRLLGAVVPHGAECEVHTKYEGHFSHQNMEVVRLILKAPVSITEPPGTGE